MRKELSSILNHFEKVYDWADNPSRKVKRMGSFESEEVGFWTLNEFNTFIQTFDKESMYYVIYNVLFFTGMRVGECLALNYSDIDFTKRVINVNKTYYRKDGEDHITSPKTASSKREIPIPKQLCDIIANYMNHLNSYNPSDRIFPIVDRTVAKQLKIHIKMSGVKEIHTHCLRHSHVALLIEMKEDMYTISKRLGHKDIKITMNKYGHLYPSKQQELANRLDEKMILAS